MVRLRRERLLGKSTQTSSHANGCDCGAKGCFMKRLPSKDKFHQLASLFGCECREGRAVTAPLLRPNLANGQQGGHLPGDDGYEDPLPNFALGEARTHRMFPQINAPPPIVNDKDWVPGENKWEQENGDSDFKKGDEVKRRGYLWVAPEQRRAAGKRGNGTV